MTEIRISAHARERMEERGVSEPEDVGAVYADERFPARAGPPDLRRNPTAREVRRSLSATGSPGRILRAPPL